MKVKKKRTMRQILKSPYYKGKHVIIVNGRVFTAKTGQGATEILKKVRKKYPKQTPEITYIPKAEALILWV